MSADTPTTPSPNAMCLILQYYRLKKNRSNVDNIDRYQWPPIICTVIKTTNLSSTITHLINF